MISSPENHFRVVPAAIRDCHRQQDTDSEKVRTIGECPTCFAVEANTWDYPTSIHHLYCQFPVRYVWSGLDPALPGTKHDNRSTPIPSDKHPELLKTEQRGTENRQSYRSIPARSSDRSYSRDGTHLSARVARINLVSPAMERNKASPQDISTTKRRERDTEINPDAIRAKRSGPEVVVCQFFTVCCCWANLGGLTAVALSLGGIVLTTFQARPSFSRTRIAP